MIVPAGGVRMNLADWAKFAIDQMNGKEATAGCSSQRLTGCCINRRAKRFSLSAGAWPRRLPAGRRDHAARVLLVSYDPRAVEVPISAGENNGRTLPHRDVVHSLIDLWEWKGSELMLKIPPLADPNYKIAVLQQQGPGGPIVAARKF